MPFLGGFNYFQPQVVEQAATQDKVPQPQPDQPPEGAVTWGGPSNFLGLVDDLESGPSIEVKPNEDDAPPDNPPGDVVVIEYEEIGRTEEIVRVTQEGNPDNWIDEARITEILFRDNVGGPYTRYHLFKFKTPEDGDPPSGGSA